MDKLNLYTYGELVNHVLPPWLAGFFAAVHHYGRGSMMLFGEDDDLVRLVILMARRRRPFRMSGRARFRSCPVPFVAVEDPAVIIRDVFLLVKDIAVFRDGDLLGPCHDDRAGRGRNDFLRCGDDDGLFYDDRLFNDRRRRFHDDRSRTGFDDRAYQIHDVRRELDAVGRRFVVVPCEGGGRSEDDRRGESGADDECLVDGLLSSVSLWKSGCWFSVRERIVLDFLIILYSELFVLSNEFLNFFRKKFRLSSKKMKKGVINALTDALTGLSGPRSTGERVWNVLLEKRIVRIDSSDPADPPHVLRRDRRQGLTAPEIILRRDFVNRLRRPGKLRHDAGVSGNRAERIRRCLLRTRHIRDNSPDSDDGDILRRIEIKVRRTGIRGHVMRDGDRARRFRFLPCHPCFRALCAAFRCGGTPGRGFGIRRFRGRRVVLPGHELDQDEKHERQNSKKQDDEGGSLLQRLVFPHIRFDHGTDSWLDVSRTFPVRSCFPIRLPARPGS